MKFRLILSSIGFSLMLLFPWALYAQEASPSETNPSLSNPINTVVEGTPVTENSIEPESTPENNSNEAPQKTEKPKPKTDDQLIDDTIEVDIRTASYEDLVFWCRRLGMDFSGSKSELQERLRTLYGVSGTTGAEKSGNQIEIRTAEKTEYYKIDEIDQDYIRIIGNVAVVLEESGTEGQQSQSSHKITADYIIFNKKEQLMTAHGNVIYEKKSGDSSEFFSGNSLVFNIQNWEGVIYKGVSQKEQETKAEEGQSSGGSHTFYYSGEKLIKGKDDKIKMINGKISSSKGDFPVYSISADRIWVLAPGEWGIRGATLQVGEVPLLYIPFFLKKGDKFVFNPAVGQNDDIGSFLNITYYLLGKKKEESSADSFNFLDPSGGKGTGETWVDGLYLRNGKKPVDLSNKSKIDETSDTSNKPSVSNNEEKPQKELSEAQKMYQEWKNDIAKQWETAKANDETYLKLMADVYSNIGQFVGLQGKISGMKNLRNFDFRAGLGLSYYGINRDSLNKGMEVQKLHKMINPEFGMTPDNLVSYYGMVPDHSYFFGFLVPFRYGLETALEYSNPETYSNTKLKMDLYSDSLYPEHFTKYRQETFNFEQALGLSEEKPIYQDATRISKLNWYLENSFNGLNKLFPKEVNPYLSSFSLSKLNMNLEFVSDVFDDTMLNFMGNDLNKIATVKKEYFVPSQMLLPDINLNLAGTLFNSKYDIYGNRTGLNTLTKEKVAEVSSEEETKGIHSPWTSQKKEKSQSDGLLKAQSLFPNVPLKEINITNLFSHQLDYNFKTLNLQLLGNFIHETPETPKLFHQLGLVPKTSDSTNEKNSLTSSIINFQLSKLTLKLRGEADLNYKASLLDDMFSLTDNLSLTSTYQKNFLSNQVMDRNDSNGKSTDDRNEQVQEDFYKQEARIDDYKNSNVKLTNNFSFRLQPFKFVKGLEGSSISYNLANSLVDYRYDSLQDKFVLDAANWDTQNVTSHTLNTNLQFKLLDQTQSLALNFLLPPKQASVSPALDLKLGMLSNRFSFSVYKNFTELNQQQDVSSNDLLNKMNDQRNQMLEDQLYVGSDNWYVKDISNNASFNFNNGISFSNNFQYNVLEDRLTNLDTKFSANFVNNNVVFNQNLRVIDNNGEIVPDRVSMDLKLWYFNIAFNASKGQPQFFDWNNVNWVNDPTYQPQLIPQTITLGLNYNYKSPALWKNRLKIGFDLNAGINYNFVRFTESSLNFKLGFNLELHKLLSFSFNVSSKNEALYLYSNDLVSQLNHGLPESQHIQPLNLFEDLFMSFGSTEQRKASNFNLASINFQLTHNLGEWDLVFNYSGSPSTRNLSTGYESSSMSWKRNFSISVVWGAINMIKTDIEMDEENNLTF